MVCRGEKIEVDNPAVLLVLVVVENHSAGPVVVSQCAQLRSGIESEALCMAGYGPHTSGDSAQGLETKL